jgi:hypothetical protein
MKFWNLTLTTIFTVAFAFFQLIIEIPEPLLILICISPLMFLLLALEYKELKD